MKAQLMQLKVSQLIPHPKNMRRFYPADQVREMADSIAANKGVLQPLIVMKEKKGPKWLVIDGNMRRAGGTLLGDKCPPLDCREAVQTEIEQFLSMITANQIRYDVDPVSEGLHYRSLQKQGLTVRAISKRTGINEARIHNTLILADLEEPVQKLMAEGKLTHDPRVARALLKLTPAVRIKLATRASENPNMKITTLLNACESLQPNKKVKNKLTRPAVQLSGALDRKGGATSGIREAARKACHKCSQFEDLGGKVPEPAWSMVMHKADETCGGCPMKDMNEVCGSCPAVELLKKLVTSKDSGRG